MHLLPPAPLALLAAAAALLGPLLGAAANLRVLVEDWWIVPTAGWTPNQPLCCPYEPLLQYQTYTANLIMGVIAFNQRRADIIPALGSLGSCSVNISIDRVCEEGGDTLRSTYDLLDAMRNEGIDAVLGYASSEDAAVGSQLAHNFNQIPAVAYWASGGNLGDKSKYPTVARTLPNDYQVGSRVVQLMQQWDIDQVVILYQLEDSGQTFADQLLADFQAVGIQTIVYSFHYYNAADIDSTVATVAPLGKNVFIFIAYTDDVVYHLANSAVAHDLVGPDKLWIFPYMDRAITAEEAVLPNVTVLMSGSLRVTTPVVAAENRLWANYLEMWSNGAFVDTIAEMNSYLPPHGSGNSWTCRDFAGNHSVDKSLFSSDATIYASEVWSWAFDAGVALGIASCANGNSTPALQEALYTALLNVDFDGLSGRVRFLSNGDRDPDSVSWKLENFNAFFPNGTMFANGVQAYFAGSYNTSSQKYDIDWSQMIFRGGRGEAYVPKAVTAPIENRNQLAPGLKALGYIELAIVNVCCLICLAWMYANWKDRVVVNAQPWPMVIIVLGCLMSSWAIFTITIDDTPGSNVNPHIACMASPVLFALGFQMALSALVAKMYRIDLLFNNKKLRRRSTRTSFVLKSVALAVALDAVIIIVWIIAAPLQWMRIDTFVDNNGFVVSSRGMCGGSNVTLGFAIAVFGLYFVSLVAAVFAARRIRDVDSEYSEGRDITFAIGSIAQIYIVAIPTVVAVYTSVVGNFMILSLLDFASTLLFLFFIFVPRMYFQKYQLPFWGHSTTSLNIGGVGQTAVAIENHPGGHHSLPVAKLHSSAPNSQLAPSRPLSYSAQKSPTGEMHAGHSPTQKNAKNSD